MCQESEANAAWPRRRLRPRQPTARMPAANDVGAPSSKRGHLVTDEGFLRRLVANLLFFSLLLAAGSSNQRTADLFLDLYHTMKERMMDVAGELAWWSLLSLLSSSCCAIQMLLNSVSLGCAGFNTVLGPLRPTFVAVMLLAQACSWYAAYYYSAYSNEEQSWRMAAGSTAVSGVLTLLPEMLAWQTARRERRRLMERQQQSSTKTGGSNGASANSDEKTIHLQLSTMGCSACVSTVSKVLDGIDGVLRHAVSLEHGMAEVVLDKEREPPGNHTGKERDEETAKHIAEQLERAGFPAVLRLSAANN